MRSHNASPRRGIRFKWFSLLTLLAFTLTLTSVPPPGAFAQDQQQAAQQTQQAGEQKITGLPEIIIPPISLEGPIDRAKKDGTAMPLSLRDLIKLALQSNLDIAIAETRETSLQQDLIQAHANYDPRFSGSFDWSNSKSLNTQSYDAGSTLIRESLRHTWSATVNQNLPTGIGTSWTFRLGGNRNDSNQITLLSNVSYGSSYSLSITQPLLKDRKIDANRNELKVVNLNIKNNDRQFRQSVSNIVAQVQNAYWDLVTAINRYDLQKASVLLTRTTVQQNKKKVEVGTMAPIDVLQSQSSQASQEVSLLGAADTILNRENALKQLISKDRTTDIWGKTIVPTDAPDFVEYKVDLTHAIETALRQRPEIEDYDIQLAQSDLSIENQRNTQRWQLNLTAGLSGGSTAVPEGNKNYPSKFWGGLGNSYLYLFNTTPPSWSVGTSLAFPLRNRDNEAAMAKLKIARQQILMNRTKQEQTIIVAVQNAVQGLETAKRQIDTAKIGTQIAQANLEAENKRLEAGLSQTFQLLDAQNRLANARDTELNQVIAYRRAIITLQQAMFTLLDESSIDVGKDVPRSKFEFK